MCYKHRHPTNTLLFKCTSKTSNSCAQIIATRDILLPQCFQILCHINYNPIEIETVMYLQKYLSFSWNGTHKQAS